MTHPSNLTAATACWSIRRAWVTLRDSNSNHDADADAGTLKAWRPGTGGNPGGHADAIATAVLARTTHSASHARTVELVTEQVAHARFLIVSALRRDPPVALPPLAAIGNAIPALDPPTAEEVARYLTRADRAIRQTLRIEPDHLLVPGNPPCPGCGTRLLRVQTSAPDSSAWTVHCLANCRCGGSTCPCQMTTRAAGVGHIWNRESPFVAAQLARLPRRRVRHPRAAG